jgi:hypothetical protein
MAQTDTASCNSRRSIYSEAAAQAQKVRKGGSLYEPIAKVAGLPNRVSFFEMY